MITKTPLQAVALALALAGTAGLAEAKTLSYSEYGPEHSSLGPNLKIFAEDVARATDGALKVQTTFGGALIAVRDVLRGVGDGVADMGSIVAVMTPSELFNFRVGDLPIGNSDPWVGMSVMQELAATNDTIKGEFAAQNVKLIANFTTTEVVLICSKPVASLDDLKGLKIRSNPPHSLALKAFGAIPVSMGFPEVYQALDRGLITCAQTYVTAIMPYRHFEVAKHVLRLDFGQNLAFGAIINQQTFDKLDASQQAALLEAGRSLSLNGAKTNVETLKNARDTLENDYGVEFHSLSQEDHARLMEAGGITLDSFLAKGDPAVLDQFKALQAKYTAEFEANGYPWDAK